MAETASEKLEKRIRSTTGQRILAIARELVAERGVEGTHIIEITRRAGIARGLVNYYFGSKNRLLGEVLDADAADRRERLRESLGGARTLDEVMAGLAQTLGELLVPGKGVLALQELATLALRDADIAARQAVARSRYRDVLAEILVEHEQAGIVQLRADPTAIAAVLVALGQGIVSEQLADPNWDHTAAALYALSLARCALEPAPAPAS